MAKFQLRLETGTLLLFRSAPLPVKIGIKSLLVFQLMNSGVSSVPSLVIRNGSTHLNTLLLQRVLNVAQKLRQKLQMY